MFKFSVIVPIYNSDKYLEGTIQSILKQSIGFEKNIQLILIDDGSKDASSVICLKYKEKYPNNIIYIYQDNSGVSVARNIGLKQASGRYINFLDSDDKWSKNAFKVALKLLKKNSEVDFVSFKMKYFDNEFGNHYLNYKYKTDRVININDNYNYLQTTAANTFIKSSVAKKFCFDSKLKYGEDGKYINSILFNNNKYVVSKKECYFYRRRGNNSSAIQGKCFSPNFFVNTPKYFYKYFIDLNNKNKISKYFQYLIFNDIYWALSLDLINGNLREDKELFFKNIKFVLQYIDDDIIFERSKDNNIVLNILKLKYGYPSKNINILNNFNVFTNNLKKFRIKNNYLYIEGNVLNIDDSQLFYEINGKSYKIDLYDDNLFYKYLFNNYNYSLNIKLQTNLNIKFYLLINSKKVYLTNKSDNLCNLSNYRFGYYYNNGFLCAKDLKKTGINIIKSNAFLSEIKFLLYIIFKKHQFRYAFTRVLYFVIKIFIKNEICIVSLNDYNSFIKNNMDFKKYNIIVINLNNINSIKYKVLYLLSSYIFVSNNVSVNNFNPWNNNIKYFIDLLNFDVKNLN